MPLLNITEIILDNNELALGQYIELIKSDKIIMVILGDSESIRLGVELADELTETSPTGMPRWVMWVRNHKALQEKLEPILTLANIIEHDTPYEEIKVFCLSQPGRKALSRVHKNGTMDFVRLESLFVEAEKASII